MMIGKRVRRRGDAHRRELREEARRMADAGQRVHVLPRERRRRRGGQRIVDAHESIPDERHPRTRRGRPGRSGVRRRRRARRPHRPRRSRETGSRSGPAGSSQPLPKRARRVDDGDLDARAPAVVLQAVVGQDHVARRVPPRAARGPRRRGRARPRRDSLRARAAAARRRPDADRRPARPATGRRRSRSRP